MKVSKLPVTIIIPVYKDWNTLDKCLNSLKLYLDKRHKVIIVNDQSEEAKLLETNIQESIKGLTNFYYFNNPTNLGFVKTCNRAVFELDKSNNDIFLLNSDTEVTPNFLEELIEVLYINERHGVVSPRSNNASIASLPINQVNYDSAPFKSLNDKHTYTFKESFEIFQKSKEYLPRFVVTPTAVGFALLIKRELINNFGLFDEIYGKGYNEENDFIQRLSQFGYSSIIANRSFVFHYESKSFGTIQRTKLDNSNSIILSQRYPYYFSSISNYFNKTIDPVDFFVEKFFGSENIKKKILFSLFALTPIHNGTSLTSLNILKEFTAKYSEKYDIYVLTNKEADIFHKISENYDNVMHNDSIVGTYDLAYIPSQIFHYEHFQILNKHCARIITNVLDVIALRCNYLYLNNTRMFELFLMTLKYSDTIVTISNSVKDDILAYYNANINFELPNFEITYLSSNLTIKDATDLEIKEYKSLVPFEDYILIFGNDYKHKCLMDLLSKVKDMNYKFVILGKEEPEGIKFNNMVFFKSGRLSEIQMSLLYKFSKLVIFPSTYEGFGIPILESLISSKPILVKNTQVNNEVVENFVNDKNKVTFFNSFSEVPEKIKEIYISVQNTSNTSIKEYSWEDVTEITEKIISKTLAQPINVRRLRERWFQINLLSNSPQPNNNYYIQNRYLRVIDKIISSKENKKTILKGYFQKLILNKLLGIKKSIVTGSKSTLEYISLCNKNFSIIERDTLKIEINKIEINRKKDVLIHGWCFDMASVVTNIYIKRTNNNVETNIIAKYPLKRNDVFNHYKTANSLNSGFIFTVPRDLFKKFLHGNTSLVIEFEKDSKINIVEVKLAKVENINF